MRCAGLLLIIDNDRVVLLNAMRSYNRRVNKQLARNQDLVFLEKISIPRGKGDSDDTFDYETAVREFIEETSTFFDEAHVYRTPFRLMWRDEIVYSYDIYVALLRGELRSIDCEPNSFYVKLRRDEGGDDAYHFSVTKRRFNEEIPRKLKIYTLDDYYYHMKRFQLKQYTSSNYLDFFNFVQFVRREYENGTAVDDFFSLKLSNSTQPQSPTPPPRSFFSLKFAHRSLKPSNAVEETTT